MGACSGKEPQGPTPAAQGKSAAKNAIKRRSQQRPSGAASAEGRKPAKRSSAFERKLAREKREATPVVGLPAAAQDKACQAVADLTGGALQNAEHLFHAIGEAQNLDQAVMVLREGAEPNVLDDNGDTPLCHAIVAPTFHTVRGLSVLKHLATRAVLKASPFALTLAASRDRVRAAAMLLDLGAEVDGGELCAALSHVAEGDDVEYFETEEGLAVLQRFLDAAPAALDGADESGDTPLHNAVKYNHPRAALFLLAKGADAALRDEKGCLPLHASMDLPENAVGQQVVRELLKRSDALKDAPDAEGDTPLHFAALLRKAEFAKMLVDAGCDKAAVNNSGETPASVAKDGGDARLLAALA